MLIQDSPSDGLAKDPETIVGSEKWGPGGWIVGRLEAETRHFDSESWIRTVAVCELCKGSVRVINSRKAPF
jgi:hypothetical protein